jgi:hypothetical protein
MITNIYCKWTNVDNGRSKEHIVRGVGLTFNYVELKFKISSSRMINNYPGTDTVILSFRESSFN